MSNFIEEDIDLFYAELNILLVWHYECYNPMFFINNKTHKKLNVHDAIKEYLTNIKNGQKPNPYKFLIFYRLPKEIKYYEEER